MNIAQFCIKHKVATLLAVIMVTIFGSIFATRLQMALMPDMEAPMAVVICYYNGAAPGDMEELVTRPLESAIMSVSGVDEIYSTSAESLTQIQITYVEGTDLDIAAAKLREQFALAALPDGAGDPIIMNLNLSELMPTAMVALMGDDLSDLQQLAEDVVAPALERIDGVASVSVSGGLTRQISVKVDTARAAGFGLSNSSIAQYLAAENLLYPGGSIDSGAKSFTVSTDAKFQSVDDVANLLMALPTGGVIRLSEVADVMLEADDPDAIARVGTQNCVILQVSKRSGGNEMSTALAVERQLADLAQSHGGIRYTIPYLASDYIDQVVSAAFQNILQGMLLAAVVVFLFLRRGGATLTIVISMPVCILTVFVLMNVMDLTLNMMSLGGIAMGVGMIVDNSIVVLENIYRFFREGHSRMDACVEGTREVVSSVVASTLTTLAVFVPLGLSGGLAGMMFKDFCLTIASLILASLIIALTLVPLLCWFLLNEKKARRKKEGQQKPGPLHTFVQGLKAGYLRLLSFFIHHLKIGMLVSVLLVLAFGVTLINTRAVLIPDMDQGMLSISISMPLGSQLGETSSIADRVTAIAQREYPEIQELFYVAQDESVTMMLDVGSHSGRQRSSFEIAAALRQACQDIAGCEITVEASNSMAMLSGDDISVELTGSDPETLALIAGDLAAQIAALPDAVDVDTSLSEQVPQVKISMNREAAAQYGLTAAAVGAAVRAELTGIEATTVTLGSREYDVVVQGSGAAAASLDALRSMPVSTAFGGTVPLSSVAGVTIELAPQTINRANQSRQVTITGGTVSGNVPAITQEINAILAQYPMPEGCAAEITGSYADMEESFGDLGLALIVAIGLVYFVLAAQFESFLMPIMVMLILPVAFTGALFALPLTGRDLSIISMVSLIMLAGTVVNSSIILVEYIKIRRNMGESREDAILHACPLRIRPILMTTLTTILAMIPMALGIGETNEMMSDMGITMISGMVISTLITLVFTPVFYSVIDNLSHLFRRKKAPEDTQPVPAP